MVQMAFEELTEAQQISKEKEGRYPFIWVLLILGILMIGAYFRFTGVNWDENQHLHPDERFLTMVASSVSSVKNLEGYFDTAKSTLNPHNVGYGFYVYGTLPLFLTRWVAEAIHQTGYDEIYLVGRVLSGIADLGTVFLVYMTALRLFKRQRLALIAAAFMALAVLPIQISHYFTVDNFANFFTLLAIYFAVQVFTAKLPEAKELGAQSQFRWRDLIGNWSSAIPYILFGVGLGLALASKVSIAPLAAVLPVATIIYYFRLSPDQRSQQWAILLRNLALGAIVSFLVFRIFQPYAFSGPGFFNIGLNKKWFDNLASLQAQSSGDVDSPPELQWTRRPLTFAWTNMVEWGLGVPLGLLAWVGFLWMGRRILRGNWKPYLLIWLWTGAYFAWQALSFTRTMRYELPVYPTLAIIAAWVLFALGDHRARRTWHLPEKIAKVMPKAIALVVGIVVIGCTFAWAFAFTRIYTRPMTRVEATRWIYQNVPAPINLHIQTDTGQINQPLSYLNDGSVEPGKPYSFTFTAKATGVMAEITLPGISLQQNDASAVFLTVEITDVHAGNQSLAQGSLFIPVNSQSQTMIIPLDTGAGVKENQVYGVTIGLNGQRSSALLTKDIPLRIYSRTEDYEISANKINLQSGSSYTVRFSTKFGGSLSQMRLPVQGANSLNADPTIFSITLLESGSGGRVIGAINQTVEVGSESDFVNLRFDPPLFLTPLREYMMVIDNNKTGQTVILDGKLTLRTLDDPIDQVVPYPVRLIRSENPFMTWFDANQDGLLTEVQFGRVAQQDPALAGDVDLGVEISAQLKPEIILGKGKLRTVIEAGQDTRGVSLTLHLDNPMTVTRGGSYFIRVISEKGAVALRGSAPANESSWDDGLPLRMDGYDGFSGLYQKDLNFEMYWDDNQEKVNRFQRNLDSADFIFITSNRQWGTTTRVQERYPLTSAYYRALVGCPEGKETTWCYGVAKPGQFQGELGYDLVQVFQSDPNLGELRFNSQFAEEAFTVYDHPKVLIFQKRADYTAETVAKVLSAVDLSKVIHITPRKAGIPANLLLPDSMLETQQAGGTWSELFDRNFIYNQYPVLGLILWYLVASLLGWVCYPMVRIALGGLADKGFPVVRLVGMLILAYLSWLAGSVGFSFSQTTIWVVIFILFVVNAGLFYMQRDEILREWKQKKRYFLTVEVLSLAFFAFFLLIRLGNPDLWHPGKGGEKPMDFSYFNAVLKSTVFPPYDPWFAGGYINYYYYGFVVAGTLVKALGIIPSIAYNLILPSFFGMVALAAFSVGWNLLSNGWHKSDEAESEGKDNGLPRAPWLAGLTSAIGLLIIGNLGTVKMIWEGFQRLIVAEDVMQKGDIFSRMAWMVEGIVKYFGGTPLPFGMGEWYWNPSRAIPGDPITEFPFFTFLYADPHAHLFAMPVTILALVWVISVLRTAWNWGDAFSSERRWLHFSLSLLLGGLVIGALRLMNTWDLPTYLVIGALALIAAARPFKTNWWKGGLSAVVLAGLAFLMYQPFASWYGQGYNAIDWWKGDLTPVWAFTLHWGLFLFVIVSWMMWEAIDWMAKTPVSALNRGRKYFGFLLSILVGMIVVTIALLINKVQVSWIVIWMGAGCVVLMLRKGQSWAKRLVLFMTGSALVLTLAVELVVLVGDIGRMNTVFKFYLQAWTLLSLSAAAALLWLWNAVQHNWERRMRKIWKVILVLLVGGAALLPLMAGTDKIRDRMSSLAPITLDGMTYMAYSKYSDQGVDMDLSQDYRAIQWMQDHVQGSPVIVEGNVPEYRWGTRFTIYTGLPGVVGWNWHQRQQRALTTSEWVSDRVEQIGTFYRTSDLKVTRQFLNLYHVQYIIVGQLERAYYPGRGLDKFENQNGMMWQEVFRDGTTVIYEVLE